MADTLIHMYHPTLPGMPIDPQVPQSAFDALWSARGWLVLSDANFIASVLVGRTITDYSQLTAPELAAVLANMPSLPFNPQNPLVKKGLIGARPTVNVFGVGFYESTDETDGPTLYLSDGATWDQVAPGRDAFRNQESGYGERNDGVVMALTTTATGLTGATFTLPQINRPQLFRVQTVAAVTTAPAASTTGTIAALIVDTSLTVCGGGISNVFGANGTSGIVTSSFFGRIPANKPADTYSVLVSKGGNSTFVATLYNGGSFGPGFKSFLEAQVV